MAKLIEMFRQGGPVMWPILALSIIGLAILFWKAMEFRAGRKDGRGLALVSTIITAEPMLGILGTVTGIIQTFNQLSGADGVANPMAATAGIGHDFRHYKGKMYRLLGLAPHSETLEPMAVYQLLYGDFGLWVRPARMFFEEIEVDGRRMRRFERV